MRTNATTFNDSLPISEVQFEDFYHTHHHKVRGIVSKFGFRDASQDDIIQDVFIASWKNLHTLKEPKAISGWINKIARNECLQTLRRQKARPTIQPEDGLEEILVDEYDGMASIRFEHSLNLVRKLVESHKVEPRASVARMFYLQEKPVKDIAETLNLKQNTVLCHLRRFRLSISKALCDMVESGEIELQSRG